jgi:hypothetical protein
LTKVTTCTQATTLQVSAPGLPGHFRNAPPYRRSPVGSPPRDGALAAWPPRFAGPSRAVGSKTATPGTRRGPRCRRNHPGCGRSKAGQLERGTRLCPRRGGSVAHGHGTGED